MSFAAHNPTNNLMCNYCHQMIYFLAIYRSMVAYDFILGL